MTPELLELFDLAWSESIEETRDDWRMTNYQRALQVVEKFLDLQSQAYAKAIAEGVTSMGGA